jgi:signal transduction histidine kinase/ligand-binding sensor domain-containing protein
VKRSFSTCLASLILTLSLALGLSQPAQGQAPVLRFDHLSINDGLSHNTINAILQDRLGFIWIGTSDGLNRYDGQTFTIYRHDRADPTSLADNNVLSLFEDSRGTLWIGTAAGLDRFDPATHTFIPTRAAGLSFVQSLAEDQEQRLWIGAHTQGLWVMDLASGDLRQFRHDPQDSDSLGDDSIYDLLVTRSGEIWIATGDGLDQFIPAQSRFEHYRAIRTDPNTPTSNRLRTLLEDSAGFLWIGTDGGGLNRLNTETGAFTFFLHSPQDAQSLGDNRIWDMLEDRSGHFWLATSSGLERFDPQERTFTHYRHNISDPHSLSGSRVLSLLEDRSGAIWIGTQGAGLSLYRPAAHRFRTYQVTPIQSPDSAGSGLHSNIIQAILEDRQGALWIAGLESVLSRLEPASNHWTHYRSDPLDPRSLTSSSITSLAEDSQGRLWIGTAGGGLDSFTPPNGQFDHYRYAFNDPYSLSSNNIASLLASRSGDLWIATDDAGLNRLDPLSGLFQRFRHDPSDPHSLPSDRLTALFEDSSGALWVGTYDAGLSRLDPGSDVFHHYRRDTAGPHSLSDDQIISLAEYPAGTLWIGTRAGLNRLDLGAGVITRYLADSGLPSDTVNCIVPDGKGALWIATTNGLASFDPQDGAIRVYSAADGLQSGEFIPRACLKGSGGELYFGGVQGLNTFLPAEVAVQAAPPPVVFTAVRKDNQLEKGDYAAGEPVHLTYQDGSVSFEFAALDFNTAGGFRYAYQLVGFEEDWVDAGQRNFVSYTNLHPGEYTFTVRAANRDGVWNETGASLPVIVVPALWQTAWFQVVAVLLLALAAYGGYRLRLGEIQRRNLALERKVSELSREVEAAAVTAERSRMARDLHDSVSQSLYSLVLLAEAGQRTLETSQDPENDLSSAQSTLSRLGEIAQQALQEMRLMVYQLRQPDLAETGLAGALEQRLEAVERRASLRARLMVEGDLSLPTDMEQELYFLAQEALNNALKHSAANSILVSLAHTSAGFTLKIHDDGRGFDPARLPKGGFGLESMRQRAEKLGGKLEIVSSPEQGTTIQFTLNTGDSSWQKTSAS